jgi:hypothetical protein
LSRCLGVALFAAVICLGSRPALAEEDWTSPLRPGAWAAEFGLDVLGFSDAAEISVKRYSSERTAIRAGVSFYFHEAAEDIVYESIEPGGSLGDTLVLSRGSNNDYETHEYSLFLHIMRHVKPSERVSMFIECGPSFRYGSSVRTTDSGFPPAQDRSGSFSIDRVVALDANLGFEWFFTRRLALGARLGAWGGYSWGVRNVSYESGQAGDPFHRLDRSRTDSQGVHLQSSRATVSFSAYF